MIAEKTKTVTFQPTAEVRSILRCLGRRAEFKRWGSLSWALNKAVQGHWGPTVAASRKTYQKRKEKA